MQQCLGLTQKGNQCKKQVKTGCAYCHLHKVESTTDSNDSYDLDLVENIIESSVDNSNDKITELNEIINHQQNEIDKMRQMCREYNTIKRFEILKRKIKSLVSFTKNFYINDIVHDKQYHAVIKAEFGMTPIKLREMYFQLREQQNFYAHPNIN